MIPGFSGIDPPFGTKKPAGQSISSQEANNNIILPFKIMRHLIVSENSTTTQIQTNCVFEFTRGGISLTLGAAAYPGCRVSVINSATTDATVIYGQVSIVAKAKEVLNLVYVSGNWIVVDDYADILGAVNLSLDYAGLANREVRKTALQRIQSGIALIKNRGVISGCTVTKSASAIRNINLLTGAVFMNGMEMSCPAFSNAALVPSNNGGEAQICYAYIYLDAGGKIAFACTPLGEACRITACRFTG
jgi:hypothetical protein